LKASSHSPLTQKADSSQDEKEADNAKKLYAGFQNYIRGVAEKVKTSQTIEIETALDLMRRITESGSVAEKVYKLTNASYYRAELNIFHPVNTMVYAVRIGLRIGYTRDKAAELALAAFLHDIGMFMIPEDITGKEGSLAKSKLALIGRHPEIGINLLFRFKNKFPWLTRAVYEHHERENGQGYPRGIKGDDIAEIRIIGICDSY